MLVTKGNEMNKVLVVLGLVLTVAACAAPQATLVTPEPATQKY
jgi:uncharacterized lipoprotein YajG